MLCCNTDVQLLLYFRRNWKVPKRVCLKCVLSSIWSGYRLSIEANLFMRAIEQNFLSKCPPDLKPVFYRRLVDDAFCIFRSSIGVS